MTSHTTTTKLLLALLLTTLTIGTAAAQSIEITNPEDGAASNGEFTFQANLENVDANDPNVEYTYGEGTIIGESSDESNNYEVNWSSIDGDARYTVTAQLVGNSEVSDNIEVVYDTTEPSISGDSIDVTRNDDGTINFTFEANSDLAELSEIELQRSNSSETDFTRIDSANGVGGDSESENLVDSNDENYYDTSFDYRINITDAAGNEFLASDSSGFGSLNNVQIKDGLAPSIVDRSPEGDEYVSSDSPTVSVEVEDLLSGVKNATLNFEGEEDNVTYVGDESASLEVELDGLDEGDHTAEVTTYDQEDNSETYPWEFTVDTEKPDPDASLSPSPDGQEFLTTATPLQVEVDEDDVSPKEVERIECFVDDPSDYNNDFGSSSEYSDGSFRCGELDPSDYSEGSHSIYIEFYDRAGNVEERDLGEYVFDTVRPDIESLTVTPEYTNTEPNVTIEASDFGSGVEDAEYMFSEDVDEGDGNTISAGFEDGEMSFQPNLRNKEDGDYELFVRVQDGSGKWSDAQSVDFTLDRGALPEPELETEGTLNITSGDSTFFDVTVSNNGMVPLTNAQLEFIGEVEGANMGIEVDGESSKDVSIRASTNRSFGQTEVTLKLTNSAVSENVTVPVNVRASDEQKQQVDERIEQYETRLGLLKQNLTQLEEDGADQQLIEDMDTEIQEFESRLEQVNSSVAEGRYYEIASSINEVETRSSEAVNTTEQAKEEHRQDEKRFWMILFGLLTLGVLGGGAFVWYRSDYYLDTDDLPVDLENMSLDVDFDSWDDFVETVEEKIDDLMEGGEEEESSGDSKGLAWN